MRGNLYAVDLAPVSGRGCICEDYLPHTAGSASGVFSPTFHVGFAHVYPVGCVVCYPTGARIALSLCPTLSPLPFHFFCVPRLPAL